MMAAIQNNLKETLFPFEVYTKLTEKRQNLLDSNFFNKDLSIKRKK